MGSSSIIEHFHQSVADVECSTFIWMAELIQVDVFTRRFETYEFEHELYKVVLCERLDIK